MARRMAFAIASFVLLTGAQASARPARTGDVQITGEVRSDGFGFAAASAGDVNGDGFVDYLAGASGDDDVAEGSGEAYLFYGPLTHDISATTADAAVTGTALVEGLGNAVSGAGDVNGDGFDDFLIGARSNDANGIQAGRAFLFLGPLTGTHSELEADAIISGDAFDELGWSVAPAGDVNGDGFDDVLIGAWMADLVGQAFLFLGPVSGQLTEADAAASFTGVIFSEELGDSVAAGDLNDDGVPDLILGAPRPPVNGEDPGRTYVFFGPVAGVFSALDADVIMQGEQDNDEFGTSVSSGDVNGDGAPDLIVGARQLFQQDSLGRAYVFSGPLSPGNIQAATADAILVGEDSDPVDDDLFGESVAGVGDTNGDGFDDVVVGADTNYSGGTRSGRVYLFHGPLAGTIQASNADAIFTGAVFDLLGTIVGAAGDDNGDGLMDFLGGAPQFSNDFGYASIFFGEGTPPTALKVVVTPLDPPIVLPPEGGTVRFFVVVTNPSGASVEFDLWTELDRPDGGTRQGRPKTLTVGAGETVSFQLRQRIPGQAPAGTYTLRGLVGTFPTAEDVDTFRFVKSS
jgi:FG-GAP repeat